MPNTSQATGAACQGSRDAAPSGTWGVRPASPYCSSSTWLRTRARRADRPHCALATPRLLQATCLHLAQPGSCWLSRMAPSLLSHSLAAAADDTGLAGIEECETRELPSRVLRCEALAVA